MESPGSAVRRVGRSARLRIPPPPRLPSPWVAYATGVLVPLATGGAQRLFIPEPSIAPFVVLYLGVALAASLAGIGPGLLAVLVAAAFGNFYFIAPSDRFDLTGAPLVATLLFALVSGAIAILAGSLRSAMFDAEDRAELLRRYELLVEHTRDIVLFVRAEDGRIFEANAAATAAYGYSRDELLARTIFDLRAPETRGMTASQMQEAGASAVRFETVHQRRDGSTFAVEVSSTGTLLGESSVLISVIRDISERKRAEASLMRSEQRVRQKLDSILSPDGDIGKLELADLIDADSVQALMESFYALTRVPVSIIDRSGRILVGVGWQQICTRFHRAHPDTCARCVESDTQLTTGIRAGEFRLYQCKNNLWDAATPIFVGDRQLGSIFSGQFLLDGEAPDRESFLAQARRYGFPEDDYMKALGEAPRLSRAELKLAMDFFAKLAHMLSKLGHANVKLARTLSEREALTESLREADQRKNEFISMLSHELRNPLAPVRNGLYVLSRAAPGGAQAARALAIIDRQTAHLAKLVDDLLDITRISHGKIHLERRAVDLSELVRNVAEDHRSLFGESGVDLHVEAEAPVFVWADETRIAQVIGNLLQNAAKFTPQGGAATITTRREGDDALVRIVDDGIGISADNLSRLFRPFVQANATLDRKKGGLGLGLALAQSLIELHGGRLSAQSEGQGRGAVFEIRLALADPAALKVDSVPLAPTVGRRVLLIEDVQDTAESLRDALQLHGHRVRLASDGQQGLIEARAWRPDIILCDIGLPKMDGYALARAIRADPELGRVFLVALTGYASPEHQRAAIEAGFDLHMPKPAQLDVIDRLLERAAS